MWQWRLPLPVRSLLLQRHEGKSQGWALATAKVSVYAVRGGQEVVGQALLCEQLNDNDHVVIARVCGICDPWKVLSHLGGPGQHVG